MFVGRRPPIERQLAALRQGRVAVQVLEHHRLEQRLVRHILGVGDDVQFARLLCVVAVAREPRERHLGLGIEIGVEFVLDLLPNPIDERQRRFDGHRAIVALKHFCVASEHAHTGANNGLLHIDGADAGLTNVVDRVGHFALEGSDEFGPCDNGRFGGALAADEDH